MPWRVRARWRVLAVSPSSPGQIRSRYSSTVTCAPSRRQTEPSSRPITPAPITTRWRGTSANSRAPVESRMRWLSTGTPGSGAGSEPVAMTISRASSCAWPPSARSTLTRPSPCKRAQPLIHCTLCLRKRNSTPRVRAATLSSFCFIICARSSSGLTRMPSRANSPPLAAAYSSEACSRALDGMQPTFRQVPPRVSRPSTQATFRPSWPARMAAL